MLGVRDPYLLQAREYEKALPNQAAAPLVDKNGKPVRGKSAPQYVENGTMIGKFKFVQMIGGGGFGQIYKVVNVDTPKVHIAGKVEPQGSDQGRMILELQVLVEMRGTTHFPILYASGEFERFNFIVMELLGRNLTDVRKRLRSKRFSPASMLKVAIQLTDAFESLHGRGYIHRDVKPSNICMGIGEKENGVYLVDFGMARKFVVGGRFRKERKYAAFRGTMRYVSIRVHERREQGVCDDFISLFYSLVELCEGQLPWRNVTEHDLILTYKLTYNFESLTYHTPAGLKLYHEYVTEMQYDQVPDYKHLKNIIRSCFSPGETEDGDFDFNIHEDH